LIVAQGLALPGIWYGFMDNVVECLHERFGLQVPDAGKLVMIPYIVCSICCPFYGYVSNKYLSKRKLLIFLVPTFAALAHFIIFMIPNTKEASAGTYILIVLGLTILGLAFSGYVSIVVPSVSLVVDEAILGTAFGVLGMSNSVTESVFPMISSVIIEHWSDGEGYRVNSLLFLFVCIMAMMAGLLMLLSRNKKSRELDNLEEFEDWDG
jgi:MFS family permease